MKYKDWSQGKEDCYQDFKERLMSELNIKEKRARMKKPSLNEVEDLLLEKGFSHFDALNEASKFINHYETVGWVVGKAKHPMKNWKTAVSGWITRGKDYEKTKRHESGEIDFQSTGWSKGII